MKKILIAILTVLIASPAFAEDKYAQFGTPEQIKQWESELTPSRDALNQVESLTEKEKVFLLTELVDVIERTGVYANYSYQLFLALSQFDNNTPVSGSIHIARTAVARVYELYSLDNSDFLTKYNELAYLRDTSQVYFENIVIPIIMITSMNRVDYYFGETKKALGDVITNHKKVKQILDDSDNDIEGLKGIVKSVISDYCVNIKHGKRDYPEIFRAGIMAIQGKDIQKSFEDLYDDSLKFTYDFDFDNVMDICNSIHS